MSIVGPRPHSPLARVGDKIYADVVDDYLARYRIKPGITGWAQVCGWRGPTETVEQLRARVDYDLWYVKNANIVHMGDLMFNRAKFDPLRDRILID